MVNRVQPLALVVTVVALVTVMVVVTITAAEPNLDRHTAQAGGVSIVMVAIT